MSVKPPKRHFSRIGAGFGVAGGGRPPLFCRREPFSTLPAWHPAGFRSVGGPRLGTKRLAHLDQRRQGLRRHRGSRTAVHRKRRRAGRRGASRRRHGQVFPRGQERQRAGRHDLGARSSRRMGGHGAAPAGRSRSRVLAARFPEGAGSLHPSRPVVGLSPRHGIHRPHLQQGADRGGGRPRESRRLRGARAAPARARRAADHVGLQQRLLHVRPAGRRRRLHLRQAPRRFLRRRRRRRGSPRRRGRSGSHRRLDPFRRPAGEPLLFRRRGAK